MTLEEAINLYERQTEELYNAIPCDGCAFNTCKKEHRQLAEWLRELWALTEAEKEIRRLTLVWEEGQGIQKCIDILDKWHGEVKKNENEP